MATTELKAVITAEDKASPVLARFHSTAEGVNKVLGTGLKVALGAAVAGFGALTAVGISSVRSFNESETAIAQLNAVLKSTNQVAGITSKAAQDLASSLEKQTTFSDEAILSAENMLLTFTKVGKDVFPEATETILNMSQALGQDTKNSAIQLGKALNDPINGITALRRVGVTFTEDQQKLIEKLVESGKTMEAQKVILNELSVEFGGSAKAAAETFQGQMLQMGNQIDNVKERLGEAIVKGIAPFVEKIADFINSPEGQRFADNLTKSITDFFNFIAANQGTIFTFFRVTAQNIRFFAEGVAVASDAVYSVISAIDKLNSRVGKFNEQGGLGGLIGRSVKGVLGFAGGTNYAPGGLSVVGERGPELVNLPRGSQVVPNDRIKGMAGSNINITFNGPVDMTDDLSIDEIARRLTRQIQLVSQGAA